MRFSGNPLDVPADHASPSTADAEGALRSSYHKGRGSAGADLRVNLVSTHVRDGMPVTNVCVPRSITERGNLLST